MAVNPATDLLCKLIDFASHDFLYLAAELVGTIILLSIDCCFQLRLSRVHFWSGALR